MTAINLPHPPDRYLKFKFLSHYGDEFYCTVSQVKVHGSTMLESFQDEWQQNSVDVQEVQDYIKKKDPKPSATGIGGNNGSVSQYGGGAPGTNGGHRGSPGGGRVPQSPPASSSETEPALTPPSSDGGVEHRPHAASAATVPPFGGGSGVGGGGGSGGGGFVGAGTATVEDIVRGVPAEMVVPASTMCAGPTGTDGSCPGEVLTDRAGSGGAEGRAAAAAAGGGSTTLGAEIPTMGGGGDTGKLMHAAGGGGGAGGDGGGIGQGADSLGHPIGGGEVASAGGETDGLGSGQQEPGAANSEGGSAGNGNVGQQLGQGLADGSTGLPVDGREAPDRTAGSGAAEGVGSADVRNLMPSEDGGGRNRRRRLRRARASLAARWRRFRKR